MAELLIFDKTAEGLYMFKIKNTICRLNGDVMNFIEFLRENHHDVSKRNMCS